MTMSGKKDRPPLTAEEKQATKEWADRWCDEHLPNPKRSRLPLLGHPTPDLGGEAT